ncbi:MAG TPA: patatin-like phospholipase family protein, partial [Candidatus Limnocylindria bacterium]
MSGALGPTRRLIGDRFTLALGGGGGRGWAHIGVARALDEAGMRPSLIVGTSIGSVVGAGLAAGFSPDAIERLAAETRINELIGRPGRLALFDPQRLMERMAELLGDPTFDQLPIPFAVSAYDLAAGRRVAITSGKVVEAVQRSIAVPAFFPPCPDEQGVWCDAGPWESVPVSLARQLSPDPVIGVWIYPAKPDILASRGVAWTLRGMGR